jgi:ABC-2 type transport system permease protein
MKRFIVYAGLQCRRAMRLLPHMLAILLLLACVAGLAAAGISAGRAADASRQIALVGVVGDANNPYIRTGVDALETFDTSRHEMRFVFMDEETAIRELRAGRLSAFLYLPEDFVESIYAGDTHPIRFITPEGAGIDTLLTAELAASVARLMVETESAQFGAQRYAVDFLPDVDPYEVDNELVDLYFTMVLSRDRLFSVKLVGLADTLSFGGYFFCGILVAFLLLAGISASPLCSRRAAALGPVLRAQGFGAVRQTLGEFAAFYLLLLIGALAAAAIALPILRRSALDIPELRDLAVGPFFGTLALLVLSIGAMQFFLYELIPSPLGGILLQFLCAAAQGYVCGCFYPYTFFPEALQRVGKALPAGTALRCLSAAVRGAGGSVSALLLWTLGFLAAAAAVRAWRYGRVGA